ncbi:aldo/keto reductase [Marinomonas fungiae]|uniref:Predicted oxidoreductase (Related to aryl-alcohol dehydrogenase) n=1 Tax=Marinomonas fungiae TaxID=1137284 RepID=A0A0K6IKX7_9GAMM|nr:aldo/keto reductase [Marinomonas fungiae]CUB03972.1 Predicted oxidoreductase (related to aryl-alcohol dehydrogenase) [Marinomonas fungiae]
MKYNKLGRTGVDVSRVCLGTMTWGKQNNQKDADEQMAFALDCGVNFIDTAEMYAVPPSPETYGKTEAIIGNWLSRNGSRREDIVLATKIAGNGLSWIRNGGDVTGEAIIASVDASLARLQTDYIDLYQIHWPNRTSPHFAKHWPGSVGLSSVDTESQTAQMLEILQALGECVNAGKIKYFGLSNETPWGINEYLRLSDKYSLPRVASIQNEFSLLHAKDWPYLIENCVREDVAYLPWSPLAAGALSGKYIDGARPEGSRWSFAQRNGLFRDTEASNAAIKAYKELAESYDLTASQMALAWVDQVDGVTSTIIGATKMDQLEEDMKAFDLILSDALQADIASIFKQYPMPY